mmetsp:Transcript_17523/g.38036  ORF Transcript_17523/g.38036 Transcript_17523/m.38036 type:complete len:95 (+) Transcript_17523:394-678(+)
MLPTGTLGRNKPTQSTTPEAFGITPPSSVMFTTCSSRDTHVGTVTHTHISLSHTHLPHLSHLSHSHLTPTNPAFYTHSNRDRQKAEVQRALRRG